MPRLDEVRKTEKKRADGKWLPHTTDSQVWVALDWDAFQKKRQAEERKLRMETSTRPNQELGSEAQDELMVRSLCGTFIKGWKGFLDAEGNEMEFNRENFRTYWKASLDFRQTVLGYLGNIKEILDDEVMEEVREAFLAEKVSQASSAGT